MTAKHHNHETTRSGGCGNVAAVRAGGETLPTATSDVASLAEQIDQAARRKKRADRDVDPAAGGF